jgi:hypothetical protein
VGGLISVIICVLAATAFYGRGHPVLFWLSVVIAIISFWSWGIMHNFATQSAKRRHDQALSIMRSLGQPEEEIAQFDSQIISSDVPDMDAVPNWLTAVNMLATLSGIILLVWGAIIRFL